MIGFYGRVDDGGLRVWSDDIPGLVLSHSDAKKVIEDDVIPALKTILSHVLGRLDRP